MAKLTILKFPDPRLKKVARQVTDFSGVMADDLIKIGEDMLETMYASSGVGLAATQVDVDWRIIVIDCSTEKNMPQVLINPVISEFEGTIYWEEGCLSFPGIYAQVRRHERVAVSYQDVYGQVQSIASDGLLGVCLQHEIDHLNGITFYDHLSTLKQKLLRNKIKLMKEKQ